MKAGLDDFGSGVFHGFALIALDDPAADALEKTGKAILKAANLQEFHGCRFRIGHAQAYQEFAHAIKDTIVQSKGYARFQLFHDSVYGDLEANAYLVAEEALKALMDPEEASKDVLNKTNALITANRFLSRLTNKNGISVATEMDWTRERDIGEFGTTINLSGTQGTIPTTAGEALVRVANQIKALRFPAGPRIGSLKIGNSEDSTLVQAADVLANFGLNWAKSRLRTASNPPSTTELAKAQIFQSITTMNALPPNNQLSVTPENNLAGTKDDNVYCELSSD